jgi:hypothetical protein
MNHIGEFSKNSTISLELLIKEQKGRELVVDFEPSATIEHYEANSLIQLDNVTLITLEPGKKYAYSYAIPSHWSPGKYKVKYSIQINGKPHIIEESFNLIEGNQLNVQSTGLTDFTIAEDTVDLGEIVSGYIPGPEFQMNADIQIDPNNPKRLLITPRETIRSNHSYSLVLSRQLTSLSGGTLPEKRVIPFTTAYSPLYATPLEVRSVIKDMFQHFDIHDIYVAIRDAGQKAHQYLRLIPDADNTRFRMIQDRDASYFPATKYVLYEASKQLLSSLLIKLLEGSDTTVIGDQVATGASFALGDFEVSETSSSGSGGSTSESNPILPVLKQLLTDIERENKFWLDSMMGRNARGYAKPISGITRSGAAGPESRDI